MKRIYFAIALFLTLAVIVGTGTYTVYKSHNTMSGILDKLESAAMREDNWEATKLCDKAEEEWISQEEKLTLFVNHAEICEIGVSISALKPLIKYNEKAEFFSQLNEVRVMLTHLASMENINSK